MKGRCIVTGGAGFIGSHLVDRLLRDGWEVIAVDNLSTGSYTNIQHNINNERFHYEKRDVRESQEMRRVLQDCEIVFHGAALSDVTESMKNPALTNSVNVDATLDLLIAAQEAGVKRFIFASSAAVYEDAPPHRKSENSVTKPTSPYGASKLTAENYVRNFNQSNNLETVCLRYFNVYGTRQHNSAYSCVMANFLNNISKNKPLVVFGNGDQTRDFVHVADVVEANILATSNKQTCGEVFNVGTGNQTSINRLAQMLLQITGKTGLDIKHMAPRPGDVRHSYADMAKTQKILRFYPRYPLEEGIKQLLSNLTE